MNKYNYSSDKYSEAQFFLQLMKMNLENVEHFRYYLSAFLSASRTVLSIWRDEFQKDREGRFGKWFGSLFREEPLLEFLKNIRDINTHEGILLIETGAPYGIEVIEVVDSRHINRGFFKTEYMDGKALDKFLEVEHPNSQVLKSQKYRWKFANFPKELLADNEVINVSEEINDAVFRFLMKIRYEFFQDGGGQ